MKPNKKHGILFTNPRKTLNQAIYECSILWGKPPDYIVKSMEEYNEVVSSCEKGACILVYEEGSK